MPTNNSSSGALPQQQLSFQRSRYNNPCTNNNNIMTENLVRVPSDPVVFRFDYSLAAERARRRMLAKFVLENIGNTQNITQKTREFITNACTDNNNNNNSFHEICKDAAKYDFHRHPSSEPMLALDSLFPAVNNAVNTNTTKNIKFPALVTDDDAFDTLVASEAWQNEIATKNPRSTDARHSIVYHAFLTNTKQQTTSVVSIYDSGVFSREALRALF